MAFRVRENALSQGSENLTVANKAIVMGTRAQATAHVTTRRRLADVSNVTNAANAENTKPAPLGNENKPVLQTQKSQDSKPVPLGLRKSKATGNLLAPSTQKEKSQKEEPKEDQTNVTSLQTESYSANSLHTFIEDIDSSDGDNPQLCAEYVKDIYEYLRKLEQDYAVREDYLAPTPGVKQKPEINAKMRTILIDWLIQVHQRFSLLQETLYLTVAILDRFLQDRLLAVKRKKLQLVGVTCMWIASKYEEMYAPEISDFVYITDNAYTQAEIRAMELDILRSLDFNLGKPLPLHFLRRNSKAAGVDATQHNFAKFFMEMTLQEYSFVHISPSQLAAASLCLSCRLVNEDASKPEAQKTDKLLWEDKMVHYSGYKESSLEALMSLIASFVVKSETSKLNFVRQKYQSSKFLRISASPLLKSDAFKKLAAPIK